VRSPLGPGSIAAAIDGAPTPSAAPIVTGLPKEPMA
jgi:hypothetical protein